MWKALYDDADRSEKLLFLANLRNETQDKSGGKKKFNVPRTVSSAFAFDLIEFLWSSAALDII